MLSLALEQTNKRDNDVTRQAAHVSIMNYDENKRCCGSTTGFGYGIEFCYCNHFVDNAVGNDNSVEHFRATILIQCVGKCGRDTQYCYNLILGMKLNSRYLGKFLLNRIEDVGGF